MCEAAGSLGSAAFIFAEGVVPGEGVQVGIMNDCEMDMDVTVGSITIGDYYEENYGLYERLTVKTGKTLTASNFIYTSGDERNFIIEDGAQVIHPNVGAKATVEKGINAYTVPQTQGGNLTDGWYFIASPLKSAYTPSGAMLNDTYDLYRLNPSNSLWENIKATTDDPPPDFTALNNGTGYLYANSNDVTLQFTGELKPYSEAEGANGINDNQVPVSTGWNLVGNPFACNVYANRPFYKMNDSLTGIEAVDTYSTNAIAPCTGIIIDATEADTVTFTKEVPGMSANNSGSLQITLS